jgi:predicted ATPase
MAGFQITRVRINNYRSVAACDVQLSPLTLLVGPNGAGKSNFIDALRLVADSLRTSLEHALRDRGGISEVRRRSTGHPRNFSIRLDFQSPDLYGHYAFEISSEKGGAYIVNKEECRAEYIDMETPSTWYRVEKGLATGIAGLKLPATSPDRLLLVLLSGDPMYRPVFDGLSEMGFYNLNPDAIRDLQSPDAGELLLRDGGNIASVLGRLKQRFPASKTRIEGYLSSVVPGIVSVDSVVLGPKETLEFRQNVQGGKHSWKFSAASMSDGTLRALGILVALFQTPNNTTSPSLIAIEEPEVALHPAAADVLRDALMEASETRQVLASSHSPDLLDSKTIEPEFLIAVTATAGTTRLAPIDKAGLESIRDHLYTPGELLRINQLLPDETKSEPRPDQMHLFEAAK